MTILILPFDEDVMDNRIVQGRLYEDVEITKRFYLNYLGAPYNLRVISSMDIELDEELRSRVTHVWENMLNRPARELDESLNSLINKTRKWAYNKYFIPKSVASICHLSPTHMFFGKKHKNIAICFSRIIAEIGDAGTPELLCLDNYMSYDEEPMDSISCPQTCVNILDSKNELDNKLFMKEDPRINIWLERCWSELIVQSPPKYWNKIHDRIRTLTAKDRGILIENLNSYISAIKKDLLIFDNYKKINISKDRKSQEYFGSNQAIVFEILKELFAATNAKTLKIGKLYTNGFSGSYVFEVLISSPNSNVYINSFIVKIGKHTKIVAEHDNYSRYIESNQTYSFVKVTRPTKSINGWGGLFYKDVKMWFGEGIKKDALCLREMLLDFQKCKGINLIGLLTNLIDYQIYYTLYNQNYEKNERQSLEAFYYGILPPEYTVFVDFYERKANAFLCKNAENEDLLCRNNMTIVDSKDNTFTVHDKTNMTKILIHVDHAVRALITPNPNANISFRGKIINTRVKFYRDELEQVGGTVEGDILYLLGNKYKNVLNYIDAMLTTEYEYLYTSPVHGDLHTNNLMICDKHIAVIDYGLIREKYFTAYDSIVLLCDIIINVMRLKLSIDEVIDIVSCTFELDHTIDQPKEQYKDYIKLISIFKHMSNSKNSIKKIQEFCSSDAYYAAISLQLLTIIKYKNMHADSKRLAFILACLFCEKAL